MLKCLYCAHATLSAVALLAQERIINASKNTPVR
jgi:hypothetical protein